MHSNSSYEVVHSEERGEWFERDHVNGMTRIPSELREYIYIYIYRIFCTTKHILLDYELVVYTSIYLVIYRLQTASSNTRHNKFSSRQIER